MMKTRRSSSLVFAAITALTLVPRAALAQNAEIAGMVRDSSGAVLPGVTVEASSPALIERSRTVFTDSQGQYRVIALNPGEYKVTFTLPGFKTVIREGIILTAEFAANIDTTMAVGGLEETVTVSGQSPLVDTQATTQRRALTSELINDLPTGRSFQNIAVLVPGVQVPLVQQDVGGADGARWQTMKIHGSRDDQMPLLLNGMPFNNMNNTGGGYNHTLAINTGTVQEMTVTTSGSTTEVRTSGVVANTVAKEGSNRFSFYLYGDFANSGLQSDNLSQDLIDRGLTAVNHVKEVSELNPTVGGPLVKDRLWFYGGYRYLVSQKYLAGSFATKNPLSTQYCNRPAGCMYLGVLMPDSRDLTKQDFSGDSFHHSYTGNLTWQISPRNKANFYYHLGQRHLDNDSSLSQTPEASSYLYSAPDYVAQGHWTSPMTSRLLLEGGFAFFNETWWWIERTEYPFTTGYGPNAAVPKYEASIPTLYGPNHTNIRAFNHQYNMRGAVNYVTGSHAFKFGMQDMFGTRNFRYDTNQAQFWILFNGAPLSITQYARPLEDRERLKAAAALYAQDRWTIDNVTLNLGLRFDYHNAYVPAQDIPALPFVPPKQYEAFKDTPSWKDVSPRLGLAWDINGSGKTVLRANYGHYVASESVATATANNPVNTRINNASRTWTDLNRDFVPDCDLANVLANRECGALSAPLGQLNIVTRWDPDVLRGWGVRPNDDEILVGLQRELVERVTLDVQWTRHWFGNILVTQPRATPPEGFDSYCITAPRDSRLPNGGGNQICGFMDIKPTFFGRTPDNFVTTAGTFGDVADAYSGLDVNLTAQLARGGVASGGVSVGRERTDFCDVIGTAQMNSNTDSSAGRIGETNISSYPSTLYCSVTPPFQPDLKALVTYPLPWWGVHASATWQNRPGPQVLASHVVTNADTTLGRNLTLNSATVNLIAPGTEYGDRVNQIDVRVAKSMRVADGRGRLQASVGMYNLFNSNATLTWNTRFGPSWLVPTTILQGRLVKFGAQLDF
jgi:hypothetical protein